MVFILPLETIATVSPNNLSAGAIVYWLVTRFIIIPLGWGGYPKTKKHSH